MKFAFVFWMLFNIALIVSAALVACMDRPSRTFTRAVKRYVRQSSVGIGIAVMIMSLFLVPITGCGGPSQAQINTAVQDAVNVATIVVTSVNALQADFSLFPASDQAAVAPYVTEILNAGNLIETTGKTYLAAPGASALSQFAAAVSSLATSSSAALLNVAQVKDANSQAMAKAILATIATAAAIVAGYLEVTGAQATPAAHAALEQMKPFMNRQQLSDGLQLAKRQGIAPSGATLEAFGF